MQRLAVVMLATPLLAASLFACATPRPTARVADASGTMAGHEHAADSSSGSAMAGMTMGAGTNAPMAGHSMDHMSSMDMSSMPVTIPPGALYTAADVSFMQGMIAHHAQAIYMSRLADSNGVSPRVIKFARKIDQSQRSEILLMQGWLIENRQIAPDTNSFRTMMMTGMLTPAQLRMLEQTRGKEFDRQFLTLMILHHEGALRMVADLMASPGAAQDVDVSVFANDVEVVQTAEIALMRQMLADM